MIFSVISLPAYAETSSIYDCSATVIENVKVERITYNAPAGTQIDFSAGVPTQYITKKEEFNPGVFNGDYRNAEIDTAENQVLYSVKFRHPALLFSFSTDMSLAICNPHPGDENECLLSFPDASGPVKMSAHTILPVRDSTDTSKSRLIASLYAIVNKQTGELNMNAMLIREGYNNKIKNHIHYDETLQNLSDLSNPNTNFNLFLATGSNNCSDLSDWTHGTEKNDSVEFRCKKRN